MTDDAKARLREAIAKLDAACEYLQAVRFLDGDCPARAAVLIQQARVIEAARQSIAAEDGRDGGYFVPAMGEFCKHGMYPHCPQCAKDTPK